MIHIRTAFLSLVLVLLSALPAFSQENVEIFVPQKVGVGQPFLAQIVSRAKVEDLNLHWNGAVVKPELEQNGELTSSIAMLGTSLRAKTGVYALEAELVVDGHKRRFRKMVRVVDHKYDTEKLTVAPGMVKPPAKVLKRIKAEKALVREAKASSGAVRLWHLPFRLPVKGKKLSRFGLRRTFNGDTKRRHWGLDFRAYAGTPIHAIEAGKVVLTGHFYFAGNCAYIDHGNGVISMYCHMSKLLVKKGDEVERGQKIGLSGATGRVTGAHLHLTVYAQGVPIDPEPLFSMDENQPDTKNAIN